LHFFSPGRGLPASRAIQRSEKSISKRKAISLWHSLKIWHRSVHAYFDFFAQAVDTPNPGADASVGFSNALTENWLSEAQTRMLTPPALTSIPGARSILNLQKRNFEIQFALLFSQVAACLLASRTIGIDL
jgi:hypothetical protein